MGSSEKDNPSKAAKAPPAAAAATAQEQEQQTTPAAATASSPAQTAAVYPDWPGFQAYSPVPPHGFFHSPVASSPQGHPYMWGAQPLMPPYGTPPPPYVMYPPGGMYAHPSMPPGSHPFSPYAMPSPNGNAEGSGSVPVGAEADGKLSESKEKGPIKRSKGSLGSLNMIIGKTNNESGKTSGASANGNYSQSGDSGSEGSSDSDANSQNDSQHKAGSGQDSLDEVPQNGSAARGSQNGLAHALLQGIPNQTMAMVPMPAVGAPAGVTGPTTNLNIGMDYWGTPTPSAVVRGKVPANAVAGRENMPSEPWLQDERELKRQRRKQSNRESARRSRLRKQAECEELAQRVDSLKEENTTLRTEVERIRKEHDELLAQNVSLKERLGGMGVTVDKSDQDSDAQTGQIVAT